MRQQALALRERVLSKEHADMLGTMDNFSSDGQQVASGSDNHTARLWDQENTRSLRLLLRYGHSHADVQTVVGWRSNTLHLSHTSSTPQRVKHTYVRISSLVNPLRSSLVGLVEDLKIE